jgi:hypothetical protein
MTDRTKFELIVLAVVIGLSAFAFVTWNEGRSVRAKLEDVIAAQSKVLAQADTRIKALEDQDKQRAAETAATVARIAAAAAQQKTPEQIVKWIPDQLPMLPKALSILVPAPTPQNPTPDAVAKIPAADLPALRDSIAQCQECAVKLSSAQQDVVSRDEQLRQAGIKLSAAEKERDAAKDAAKGGAFWHRLKTNAHWFILGAAGRTVALCGTGHCK